MSRFAGLPAALKATKEPTKGKPEDNPETPETDDEDDGQTPPKSTTKEPDMADTDQNAAVEAAKKEADAAGFKRASDRFAAVMASEHYTGREAYAAKLLTKDALAGASAEDVIDLLADGPKVEQTALTEAQQREAAEAAGRAEMQAALANNTNSNINANDEGTKPDDRAKADAVWDRARAQIDKKGTK